MTDEGKGFPFTRLRYIKPGDSERRPQDQEIQIRLSEVRLFTLKHPLSIGL